MSEGTFNPEAAKQLHTEIIAAIYALRDSQVELGADPLRTRSDRASSAQWIARKMKEGGLVKDGALDFSALHLPTPVVEWAQQNVRKGI